MFGNSVLVLFLFGSVFNWAYGIVGQQTAHSSRTWIVQDLLQSGSGAVYFDPRIQNYTHLIELPETKSLYVVANGNTLIRLHSEELRHLVSFSLPSKPSVSLCSGNVDPPCEEQVAFNLLSKTRDGQNLWYCYVYQTSYMKNTVIPNVHSARCEIPSPTTLDPGSSLVQWENSVYSSLDLRKPGVYLMASDGFLYTSGWFHGALHIHRVLLPNFNGLPNWDNFLTTPDSSSFIQEPAAFIAVFETEEEVYFLLRESQLQSCTLKVLDRPSEQALFPSKAISAHDLNEGGKTQSLNTVVTRLARVCKGDRGGYTYVNEGEFVTFAKATVECTLRRPFSNSSDGLPEEEYAYTHAEAATWDPIEEQLYVTFATPRGHPKGVALCIYTKESIDKAYQSDLLSSQLDDDSNPTRTIRNTFPNICSRFSSKNLSEMELDQGRQLPRGHLLRAKTIQPVGNRPILVRPAAGQPTRDADLKVWKHMAVDHVGDHKVLYLATDVYVERYRITSKGADKSIDMLYACPIDRFQVGDTDRDQESITGLQLLNRFPASEFYILTTKHVIRLPVTVQKCSDLHSRVDCLAAGNPYCTWDQNAGLCDLTMLIGSPQRDPAISSTANEHDWFNTTRLCDHQSPWDDGHSKMDWWNHLTMVSLTGRDEPFIAALPCVQVAISPNADGSQQNLTCWCRPCREGCSELNKPTMDIINCTIHPAWSPWSPWSGCSTSCGTGIRTRTRRCDSPGPMLIPLPDGSTVSWTCESDGMIGSNPFQREIQVEQCPLQPDCAKGSLRSGENAMAFQHSDTISLDEMSLTWTPWNTCSSQCGFGVRKRYLKCHQTNKRLVPDGESCTVVGPESTESQLCQETVCSPIKVQTKWTSWFLPPSKHGDDPFDVDKVHLRQRLQFVCHSVNSTTRDLRIGRVQLAERHCAPWNGPCSPVSSQWVNPSVNQPPMATASFGSTYPEGIGHWSNWGPWSSCNQACLPPVSVTAVMNHVVPVTPYSAPLYVHGGVQTRRRTCLFTPVYGCPGGPTQANESRPCPPVPACHTDWSCWSDWSSCQPRPIDKGGSLIYSKVPVTETGPCEWKVDGIRKRVRQCVLGQGDWLANRPPSCSGPMDETESCPRLAGQGTSACPAEQKVHWSVWSQWTSCEEPVMLRSRMGSNPISVSDQQQLPVILRSRTRSCISPVDSVNIRPYPVGIGVCEGMWKQLKTCHIGAIRMLSAANGTPVREDRQSRLRIQHLLLIAFLSFLIAAFLVTLLLITLCCIQRLVRRKGQKLIRRTSNVYDQAEGSGSESQSDQDVGSKKKYNSTNLSPLNMTGPPQPLLTLPIPVKADMIDSRVNKNLLDPVYPSQAVYDSVASQDLPTSFSLTENPFNTKVDPHSETKLMYPSEFRFRTYWSSARRENDSVQSYQVAQSKTRDYMNDEHFHSHPRHSRTMDPPESTSHYYGLADVYQGIEPSRPPGSYESEGSDPENSHLSYPANNEYRSATANQWTQESCPKSGRMGSKRTEPLRPLFPEDNESLSQASSSGRIAERSKSSSSYIPPSMPLLPVRYPTGHNQKSDQSQSFTGASLGSSLEWGPEASSGRSDIYSICLERPQNPHLRDPSSH